MKYFEELFQNYNLIDWIDPQKLSKKKALKKKIPNIFSTLILDRYFLSLTFNSYEEINEDQFKLLEISAKFSRNFTFKDLLIFNYNDIFSTQIFLLYLINQYFMPYPLGLSETEKKHFQNKVINPHKKNILDYLQKLILKRPESFKEEDIAYKIVMSFFKYLKIKEEDNLSLFDYSKNIKKSLNQYKFPSLDCEYFAYSTNREETVDYFYKMKFNDHFPQEIIKNLTIIDLRMLLKFNRNTQIKICKKNEERYNFFINFLVLNILTSNNLKKKSAIIENYYKITDLLYIEKNYSSLLLFFTCLSKLELILPKFMRNFCTIQKNHIKESNFFLSLLDGSYEQISNKWKNDLNKEYFSIPFLNYYQRHLNFTENKKKEEHYLDLGKMKKIFYCFNEVHDIKTICSKKIINLTRDFVKNELYYFLKRDYKIILRNFIPNLEKISNQELEIIVLNMAESFEKTVS